MKRGFLNGAKAAKLLNDGLEKDRNPSLQTQKLPNKKEADKTPALKFTNEASTGWTLKYLQYTFIHHVVSASDGSTDCLLLGSEIKNLITEHPFPISKPSTPPYVIRPTGEPETGLGMFATRDLQIGELILCERPLLIVPRLLDSSYVTGTPTYFHPQKNPANRAAWEAVFCPFFERISKEKQVEYRALGNSHPDDGIGPLLGILRTNSFEHCFDETNLQTSYAAAYKAMSRVNHSCAGRNAHSRFLRHAFALEFRALRDIKKDEEIFVSYCGDTAGTTAERQTFLMYYGFQCTCASCTSPVSDRLYLKILSSHQELDKSYESWLKDLTLPDDHITKPSLVWTSLMEQQGIPVMDIYGRHLQIIMKSFVALGDLENSVKHGTKYARFALAVTGLESLVKEHANPNYYLRDKNFGTRRRVGQAKGKGARVAGTA